tara:strand:+ start:2862 stop:3173 length:312 start_codon:yes stop_codon:yes gene_type:complete
MKIIRTAKYLKMSMHDDDGYTGPDQAEQVYEENYEVPVPPEMAGARVVKTYPMGRFVEIEKYDNGYFGVVGVVHGTTVLWTRKWDVAKSRATEIAQHYGAMGG